MLFELKEKKLLDKDDANDSNSQDLPEDSPDSDDEKPQPRSRSQSQIMQIIGVAKSNTLLKTSRKRTRIIQSSNSEDSEKSITPRLNLFKSNIKCKVAHAIKEENSKKFYSIFKQWRMMDALGSLFAFVGLVLGMVNYEINVMRSEQYEFSCGEYHTILKEDYNVMTLPKGIAAVQFFETRAMLLRWGIFLTSLISSGFFIRRHWLKLEWTNKYYRRQLLDGPQSSKIMSFYYNRMLSGREEADTTAAKKSVKYKRSPLHPKVILNQLYLILINPWPFYDRWYIIESGLSETEASGKCKGFYMIYLGDILFTLMFFRLFFVSRSLFNYSVYTDPYSKKLCRQQYGFGSGMRFAMRVGLITNPGLFALQWFIFSILMGSYMMRVLERPLSNLSDSDMGMDSFFGGVYLVTMTVTTVGYGDVAPKTVAGKTLAMLLGIWGSFLISMMVLTATSTFELTKNQQKAMRHIQYSQSAAKSIASAMKFYMAKKEYYKLQMQINPNIITRSKFLQIVLEQKKARQCSHQACFFDDVRSHALKLARHSGSDGDSFDLSRMESPEVMEQTEYYVDQMSDVYDCMLVELEEFQRDKDYFQIVGDFKESEILMSNRLIKKEVIDMADMIEKLTKMVREQSKQIANQNIKIDLLVTERGQQVDQKAKVPTSKPGAEFSIRRSPFYQSKVYKKNAKKADLLTRFSNEFEGKSSDEQE